MQADAATGSPPAMLAAALARLDPARIPVLIPVFENPSFTAGMIAQLRRFPALAPVVIDNGSTFAPMRTLLAALEAELPVVRLGANLGPRFAAVNAACLEVLPQLFCLTDPDLRLNDALPQDFHLALAAAARDWGTGKAGFALDISEAALLRPDGFSKNGRCFTIRDREAPFWRHRVGATAGGDAIYRAGIDTTFALYDRAHYDPTSFLRAVRIAGRFTCQHLPWRRDYALPPEEAAHYSARQRFSTYLQAAADSPADRHDNGETPA